MIPGAACGVDVLMLLDNAERMAHACAACVPAADNPGLVLGAIIGACATHGRDKLTLVTSSGIRDFGAWLEQLLAESTGKHGKGVIPVDREPLGHACSYGSDRLFVYLNLASDADALQDARVKALEDAGNPVLRITLDDVYDLGGEFLRWQFATAVAGSIIGINPFDQPDVEDAKVAARELTDAYEEQGRLPDLEPFYEGHGFALFADERNASAIREAARQVGSFDGLMAAHLSRVQPGDYVALLAYVPMTNEHERLLTDIRAFIRDRLGTATCVGFGPRFQHSTGQVYKGGPNSGVFLQITCHDSIELEVPGHSTRADGIERLWEIATPLLERPPEPRPYAPGSWGPHAIEQLVAPTAGTCPTPTTADRWPAGSTPARAPGHGPARPSLRTSSCRRSWSPADLLLPAHHRPLGPAGPRRSSAPVHRGALHAGA